MSLKILWIIGIFLFLAIDMFTSMFIMFNLAIGCLVALVFYMLGVSETIQIIGFLIISIVGIWLTIQKLNKLKTKLIVEYKDAEQKLVGQVLMSSQDIKESEEIKINGIYWHCINKGEVIKEGDKFLIKAIEGNKLIIEKVEN